MDERERRALVKELAGAVSVQAQVANRAWLSLITVALFAVLPRVPTKDGNVSLPFSLGEVDPIWFHAVVFFILVVLTIFFAAAHAQQVRAQKLAQTVVDSLGADRTSDDSVHPRELFDMLRVPSLNRVAPLAQMLMGRYQFYATVGRCPKWLRVVSVSYYGLVKLVALVVFFGLPVWALWHAYGMVSLAGCLRVALAAGGSVAGVTLVQVLITDAIYMSEILRHLWRASDSYKG